MDDIPENSWNKFRQWIAVAALVSLLAVLTALFLQFAPQYTSQFLYSSLIGLLVGLVLILFLIAFPHLRVRFREVLKGYSTKTRTAGTLYRRARFASFIFSAMLVVSSVLLAMNPTFFQISVVAYVYFSIVVAFFASFIIYISSFLRTFGKVGLLLVVIGLAIATLRWLLR